MFLHGQCEPTHGNRARSPAGMLLTAWVYVVYQFVCLFEGYVLVFSNPYTTWLGTLPQCLNTNIDPF